jgi:hypothetical protein
MSKVVSKLSWTAASIAHAQIRSASVLLYEPLIKENEISEITVPFDAHNHSFIALLNSAKYALKSKNKSKVNTIRLHQTLMHC